MASWLDILSQDYSDRAGRTNPFALARGFTTGGRRELDQRNQVASMGRDVDMSRLRQQALSAPVLGELERQQAQAASASLSRREGAIGQVSQQGAGMTPDSPEAADVIMSILGVGRERQGQEIAGAQEARSAEGFAAERPFLPEMARIRRDASQEGVRGAAMQREIAMGQAGPNNMQTQANAELTREQTKRLQTQDPRLGYLLDAVQATQLMEPGQAQQFLRAFSSMLGPTGERFNGAMYPPAPPDPMQGAQEALAEIIKGQGRFATQASQSPRARSEMAPPSSQQSAIGAPVGGPPPIPRGQAQQSNAPGLAERVRSLAQRSQFAPQAVGGSAIDTLRPPMAPPGRDVMSPQALQRILELIKQTNSYQGPTPAPY
jgi:hypothetical protein